MRRQILIPALLCAVTLCSQNACAFDVYHKFIVMPRGGVAIPIGDFADDDSSNANAFGAKTGFGLGATVEFGITEEFLVGGRFGFNRFAVERSPFGGAIADDPAFDGHWSVVEIFGAYAKFLMLPGHPTRPYLRGGLFLGKPKLTCESPYDGSSKDYDVALGFDAGIGVMHMFTRRFGLGAECRYVYLNANESGSGSTVTALTRRATVLGPNGVRDPGGNITLLGADVVVVYSF